MNKKLFKFIRDTQTGENCGDNIVDQIVGDIQASESKSDKLIPIGGNTTIDVVKDFKWTKTKRGSEGRAHTPTLELQEFYVTVPAFFSNLNVAKQVVTDMGNIAGQGLQRIVAATGHGQSVVSALQTAASAVNEGTEDILRLSRQAFGAEESATKFDGLKYLKAYEHLYGVKRSNFIYKLPYLTDEYKQINNQWGTQGGVLNDITQQTVTRLQNAFSFISPGVGIDYSQTWQYPAGGGAPVHTVRFFLDNTKDETYSGEVIEGAGFRQAGKSRTVPNYETNFRLVYLLLYQNMPNRLNRVALSPPVIYRSKVPGVFSYRYSYLQSLNIKMLGTRRTKTIPNFIDTEGGKSIEVVIPEGYEIDMKLKSLVPETQNLYFDAINNPVFSTQED